MARRNRANKRKRAERKRERAAVAAFQDRLDREDRRAEIAAEMDRLDRKDRRAEMDRHRKADEALRAAYETNPTAAEILGVPLNAARLAAAAKIFAGWVQRMS